MRCDTGTIGCADRAVDCAVYLSGLRADGIRGLVDFLSVFLVILGIMRARARRTRSWPIPVWGSGSLLAFYASYSLVILAATH
jgi:divalent metal cation (Fe/Co/Zn/Cd) transporter